MCTLLSMMARDNFPYFFEYIKIVIKMYTDLLDIHEHNLKSLYIINYITAYEFRFS